MPRVRGTQVYRQTKKHTYRTLFDSNSRAAIIDLIIPPRESDCKYHQGARMLALVEVDNETPFWIYQGPQTSSAFHTMDDQRRRKKMKDSPQPRSVCGPTTSLCHRHIKAISDTRKTPRRKGEGLTIHVTQSATIMILHQKVAKLNLLPVQILPSESDLQLTSSALCGSVCKHVTDLRGEACREFR